MTLDHFVASRSARWQEFEKLLAMATQGRFRSSSTKDIEAFGRMFRMTTSDLAIAQRDFPGEMVTAYLNGLCTRARTLISRGQPMRARAIPRWFLTEFPRTFRAAMPF